MVNTQLADQVGDDDFSPSPLDHRVTSGRLQRPCARRVRGSTSAALNRMCAAAQRPDGRSGKWEGARDCKRLSQARLLRIYKFASEPVPHRHLDGDASRARGN